MNVRHGALLKHRALITNHVTVVRLVGRTTHGGRNNITVEDTSGKQWDATLPLDDFELVSQGDGKSLGILRGLKLGDLSDAEMFGEVA